jgi:hypothetical protein
MNLQLQSDNGVAVLEPSLIESRRFYRANGRPARLLVFRHLAEGSSGVRRPHGWQRHHIAYQISSQGVQAR